MIGSAQAQTGRPVERPKVFRGGWLPWPGAAAVLVAFALAGCETVERASVPQSPLTVAEAFRAAEQVRGARSGRWGARGAGQSMAPLLGPDTVLVMHPIAYEDLRAGMWVAYRDQAGRRIVHQLVVSGRDGWRVQGLNNERLDRERVTPENLLGVVYGVFYPRTAEAAHR